MAMGAMAALTSLAAVAAVAVAPAADVLSCHDVVLGDDGQLISWLQPQDTSMGRAATAAANFFAKDVPHMETPIGSGGRPAYFFWPLLETGEPCGAGNLTAKAPGPSNPTGMYGMMSDALTLYHAYSGDASVLALIPPLFDYVLANGTTPDLTHWVWPAVPYASSTSGDLYYCGALDVDYYNNLGSGDGPGVIEPDKLGEFGLQLLTAHKLGLGGGSYQAHAIHYADVLCANLRDPEGLSARQSPWPFRVHAQTGVPREEYSAAVLGPIKLLDELIRLGLGEVGTYRAARAKVWQWMMRGPMTTMYWCGYFEDIPSCHMGCPCPGSRCPYIPPVSERGNWHHANMTRPIPAFMAPAVEPDGTWLTCNYNNYSPLETARYLMTAPGVDPDWREHASRLVDFVTWSLVDNILPGPLRGIQWGARVVSEQAADHDRMVSHTTRYASVLALLAERTSNHSLGAIARRSWDWGSYMSHPSGRVVVGVSPNLRTKMWFSDSYGDFIRNTMHTLAANASWAPAGESHILRSSSVVTSAAYENDAVRYSVYDAGSVEKLSLGFVPRQVSVDGVALPMLDAPLAWTDAIEGGSGQTGHGWWFGGASGRELVVKHAGRDVVIGP